MELKKKELEKNASRSYKMHFYCLLMRYLVLLMSIYYRKNDKNIEI